MKSLLHRFSPPLPQSFSPQLFIGQTHWLPCDSSEWQSNVPEVMCQKCRQDSAAWPHSKLSSPMLLASWLTHRGWCICHHSSQKNKALPKEEIKSLLITDASAYWLTLGSPANVVGVSSLVCMSACRDQSLV